MFEVPLVGRPTSMRCHHHHHQSVKIMLASSVGHHGIKVGHHLVAKVTVWPSGISNSSVFSVLFGPVVTSCVHPVSRGYLQSSNTAVIEAMSFFGTRHAATKDARVCLFHDSAYDSCFQRWCNSHTSSSILLVSQGQRMYHR